MSGVRVCGAVKANGEVCGRAARARTFPGGSAVCGIHARAAEMRSEEVEFISGGRPRKVTV